MKNIKKGEIYIIDLGKKVGSEQSGLRPALIIQNDVGNRYSPTTIVATITSKEKNNLPTHYQLNKDECGIQKDSTVLFEQIFTIDKTRLVKKVGEVTKQTLKKLDDAAKVSLGITA